MQRKKIWFLTKSHWILKDFFSEKQMSVESRMTNENFHCWHKHQFIIFVSISSTGSLYYPSKYEIIRIFFLMPTIHRRVKKLQGKPSFIRFWLPHLETPKLEYYLIFLHTNVPPLPPSSLITNKHDQDLSVPSVRQWRIRRSKYTTISQKVIERLPVLFVSPYWITSSFVRTY